VSDAARATSLPVATSPVRDTIATVGWRTSPAPAGSPCPKMTFSTPTGRCSAAICASTAPVIGVCSDGLSTTVFPAASAGPIFHAAIISG